MSRYFTCFFAAVLASVALFAQTPEEILARMDQQTERFEQDGCSLVMDVKIPILGTFSSKMYLLGDQSKSTTVVRGVEIITWTDRTTNWTYDSAKNEITVENLKSTEDSDADNVKMLAGITEGYDVQLKKEDAQTWYFRCTKLKSNSSKDDPKTMDLAVSKSTYLPVSLKASEKGVTITMHGFSVGATEKDVTFNAADFPNAEIIDKR